jgi:hypothetical protein
MKLTYLALVLTLALLGVTTWIAWDEHATNTEMRNKQALLEKHASPEAIQAQEDKMLLEQLAKSNAAPVAPIPVAPPPSAKTSTFSPPQQSVAVQDLSKNPHISSDSLNAQPPPLTPQQQQAKFAPAIARVSEYKPDYGFVVVTAGATRKLEKGMNFALRHDGFIVGRIKISDVDENSAVGDLDAKSVPDGVTITVGDDVIQDLPTGS